MHGLLETTRALHMTARVIARGEAWAPPGAAGRRWHPRAPLSHMGAADRTGNRTAGPSRGRPFLTTESTGGYSPPGVTATVPFTKLAPTRSSVRPAMASLAIDES